MSGAGAARTGIIGTTGDQPPVIHTCVEYGQGRIWIFGCLTEGGANMAKGRDKRKESKGKKKAPKKPATAG